MSLIELRSVACDRGGRRLFEGLDLVLEPGGAALVTGSNGIGKSSLIRVAAGLLKPGAGTVERRGAAALADESLALDLRLPLRRALAFWAGMDSPNRVAALTDRDGSVEAGSAVHAWASGLEFALDRMGIGGLAAVPVRMLSTGQRKRAVLARVIASGAPIWLLDEPANGLDGDGQSRLESAIAAHRAGGGAVLAASHQSLGLPGAARVALE
ncbi:MAG TPA: ATP-binding cassette domain-containing protein [Allosphingosinicella sp.]|nr:ATP-binding cassette domain-containing protein [Allosphingosinicella sp.]